MSLYEMLPQKLPQPESSPESGDVSHDDAWLDPFSALAEEALELYGEVSTAGQQSAADAGTPGDGIPLNIRDESALQAFIRQAFAKKLPQIAEFREKGYNLSGPDEGAMKTLQAALAQVDKQPETAVLTAPAKIFLAALGTLPVNDPAMPPVLQDTVLQANRLVRLLTTALEALAAGAKVRGLDWAEEAKKTARQQREKLAEALAQEGLSPQAQKAQRLQAEGLMFSETYRLSAEYKKFSQLQDSLLAESRIVRHRLTQYLEGGTVKVEEGARDIREFALSTLLAQSDAKPSGTPEQLAVWGARLQQYARHLPGRDADVDRTLLAGNPLAAALSSVLKQPGAAEPPHVRLARAMLPVTTALGQATVLLAQVQQQVALPEEESRKLTVKPDIPLLKQVREAGRGVLAGSATLARRTGHRVSRGALRTGHLFLHQVLRRATDPDGLDRAVRNTGLLLLDEIQQAERQIKQLATRAWLLQEALEQQWRVQATSASLAPTLPELAALLDERLAQEASRWQQTGQQALTQLEALLAPFARLTESGFYTRLSEELQQAKALSEQQRWGDIGRMAEMMSGVADELAGVARGLDSAVIRLSEHGHAGGRELDIQLRNQTRKLEQLKAQVKTRIIRITGTSLDSFSRGGMLARGIAEWAEALKQDYLAGIPAEQRAQAAEQFDRALKGVMEENREQFARGGDPQAEGFLKRLALALQHAATGTQVYPPTAEEILAGSRSVPEDIRRWAERKVLGGALWAALRGGFNLVTGPVSLPLRVAIRGARTGYTLAGGLRKMNRVRLGEAPARGIKSAFIGQALAKIGIRLALSLSPGVGWGVAVTITAWEAGKNRHDNGALKKMVKRFALNIPEEGLWAGGYAGGHAAIISVIRARAEQELQDAIDKIVAEMKATAADVFGEGDLESYLVSTLSPEDLGDESIVTTDSDETVQGAEAFNEGTQEGAISSDETVKNDETEGESVEEDIEGTLQLADDALETEAETGQGAAAEQPPATQPRPVAPLKRPGVKFLRGSVTPGGSLASGTQTTPAEEAETSLTEALENEPEDTIPHGRGKRAAPSIASLELPAPKREAAIDADLEQRVMSVFPASSGVRKPVDDMVLKYAKEKVYNNSEYHEVAYIYIGGVYRYLRLSNNKLGQLKGHLYAKREGEWSGNLPIAVKFNYVTNTWCLENKTGLDSGDTMPPTTSKLATPTRASTELYEEAKKWWEIYSFSYDNMVPGEEGAIYNDGVQKYIFLANKYWPITFSTSSLATIKGANQGDDVALELIDNQWYEFVSGITQKAIEPALINIFDNLTVNSDLLDETRKWDETKLSSGPFIVPDPMCRLYRGTDNENYMYINGMNLQYKVVDKNTGAVFINENGQERAVLVQSYNGYLYFVGKIAKKDFNEFVSLLISNNFEIDIATQILDLLEPSDVPQGNILNKINSMLNDQFNRTYTQPTSRRNEDVLKLKAIISSYLDTTYEARQYQSSDEMAWDASLLHSYQYAMQNDIVEPLEISRAQFARTSVAEMEKKSGLLKTNDLQQRINSLDIDIRNKEIKKAWANEDLENVQPDLFMERIAAETKVESIQGEIDELKKQRNSLEATRKEIVAKKEEYQRNILLLTDKYSMHWSGKDWGKKTYEDELKKQGDKSDRLRAAKNALILLVLQEVDITHHKVDEYTKSDLDRLKKIRAARVEIKQILFRQDAFNLIFTTLTDSDINKTVSKKDYNDILWANRQAEKLGQQYFSGDDNIEARVQLPAILYWLLKKGKNVSDLRNQDIDTLTEEYYADLHRLNPLTEVKTMPEGYRPLSSMMASNAFSSYSDYVAQFNDYINKYSAYDASEISKQILTLSGLPIEDMITSVKKRIRLRVTQEGMTSEPSNCELLFLQLKDGRWIFCSIFPGSTFCKVISDDDMLRNENLRYITKISNSNFPSPVTDANITFGKVILFENKQWEYAVTSLTTSVLYKDKEIPNIFKDEKLHHLYYNVDENSYFSGNVISALNASVRTVLQRSAKASKIEMFTPSALQEAAFALIPYYKEIYMTANDPQHNPDIASVVVDTLGVLLVAGQAGVQVGTIIKNIATVGKITQQGLRAGLTGRGLQLYVIKNMAEEVAFASLKLLKTTASSLIDLVDPVSLRDAPGLARSIGNKASNLISIIPRKTTEAVARGINKKYIRANMTLDGMTQKTVHGAPVYSPSSFDSGEKKYYIMQDGNVYEVRWDEAYHTWRTVDPQNPSRFSYGEPIVYENGQWKINKDYGGLRGGDPKSSGASTDPGPGRGPDPDPDPDLEVLFGSQSIRQNIPEGVPSDTIWNDEIFKGDQMLADLKKRSDIREALKEPKEKCESITGTVAQYMKEQGFVNIRFRGMAIFSNGGDEGAINHFVVVGTRHRKDYVFDLTAGQFSTVYPDLSGPHILPEKIWAQKYANVSQRALMKYGDYTNQARASYYFGPFSKWLSYGPNTVIPGATVLKKRSWYFPGDLLAKSKQPGFTMIDLPVPEHPIRTAYRNTRAATGESGVCWDYAVGLVEDAKLIDTKTANDLRNGLKQAAQYKNTASSTGGGLDGLFSSTKVLNNNDELSRMKPGELLLFMEVDPNNVSKGPRPIHCVVSLGNGRFAGTKNGILDPALGDHKRLLNIRQLGEFYAGLLKRTGDKSQPTLLLVSGRPYNMVKLNIPIHKLAEIYEQPPVGKSNISKGTTSLLAQAEELSPEQAHELYVILKEMISLGRNTQRLALNNIFSSTVTIQNQAQLGSLPRGKLILFEPYSNKGPLRHAMYSLGDKKFLMIDPGRLDKRLTAKTGVINASSFPDDLFKTYKVSTGELHFTKLSNQFLLRWGIVSVWSGSFVGIGLQEAMVNRDIVRPADAEELVNDIIESILSKKKDFSSMTINKMGVSSCFGSYGSYPPEKALAYYSKKSIQTTPWVFGHALRADWYRNELRKYYEPKDFKYPDDVKKTTAQELRNNAFWKRLKNYYHVNLADENPTDEFGKLLLDLAKYARWEIHYGDVLVRHPKYKPGFYVKEDIIKTICEARPVDDDSMAERLWDLLMVSSYTADVNNGLLTKYLS
ncbi:hypothetical protein AAEY27_00500 [Kosakonia sp. BYX6]|uniref:Tox-PLDMTX domain-containing protein n=1 Tax=Kosakonia calanthes TaxID=3139408 RepID=A0ABZ3B6T4_9ENTR